MNRKHTVEQYLEIYDKLIKINKEIKFSSDFIVGYPGEKDQDFNDTIRLIKKIEFINSFSFIFSPRPGTKAGDLNLLDKDVSLERLKIIQKLLFTHQLNVNRSLKNKSVKVLVENKTKLKNKLFGRNKYLNSVIINGKEEYIGKLVNVYIDNYNQNTLFGKVTSLKNKAA